MVKSSFSILKKILNSGLGQTKPLSFLWNAAKKQQQNYCEILWHIDHYEMVSLISQHH